MHNIIARYNGIFTKSETFSCGEDNQIRDKKLDVESSIFWESL
jgi:hypothetical protein